MSGRAEVAAALESALGPSRVRPCSLSLLGEDVAREIVPRDGEEVSRALRALAACGGRALVRGGGTRDALGNRLAPVDIALSTRELAGIEELDAQDGVVRARAGTRIGALRDEARAKGFELPLCAPATATLGGVLASAAFGPRRLGFGAPKHTVLGLDVVLGSGERTRCGGRVVKNVTGFDLAKLYVGSFGVLGVIEAAWLRLRPRAEREAAFALAAGSSASEASNLAIEIARRSTARCAALLSSSLAARVPGEPIEDAGSARADGFVLVGELAGAELAVGSDLDFAMSRAVSSDGARTLESSAIDALGAVCDEALGERGLRARIAVLPSAVGLALAGLAEVGAELVAHPGLGLVHAQWRFAPGETGDLASLLAIVERVVRELRGVGRFESIPVAAAEGRDVFAVAPRASAVAAISRSLERRFDPHGVLAVGRASGRT